MDNLPEKVRVTNCGWSEDRCTYKVQIGTSDLTIAYAWVPGGGGDRSAHDRAMRIAERLCEGWNTTPPKGPEQ